MDTDAFPNSATHSWPNGSPGRAGERTWEGQKEGAQVNTTPFHPLLSISPIFFNKNKSKKRKKKTFDWGIFSFPWSLFHFPWLPFLCSLFQSSIYWPDSKKIIQMEHQKHFYFDLFDEKCLWSFLVWCRAGLMKGCETISISLGKSLDCWIFH